jgi:hypothetical protein
LSCDFAHAGIIAAHPTDVAGVTAKVQEEAAARFALRGNKLNDQLRKLFQADPEDVRRVFAAMRQAVERALVPPEGELKAGDGIAKAVEPMPLRKEVAGPSPRTPPFPDLPPHAGVPIDHPGLQHLNHLPGMAEDLRALRTRAGGANEPDAESQDQWLTYEQAGRLLDRSRSTVCEYVRVGRLKGNGQQGKGARVSKASVVDLALELKNKTLQGRGQAVASADPEEDGPPADANPERPTLTQQAERIRREMDRKL